MLNAGGKTTLFREVNERIDELLEAFGADEEADFLCECPSAGCLRRIALSRAAFDRIRTAGAFVAALQCARWATALERTADYAVVDAFVPPLATIRAAGVAARSPWERPARERSRPRPSPPAPSARAGAPPARSQREPSPQAPSGVRALRQARLPGRAGPPAPPLSAA